MERQWDADMVIPSILLMRAASIESTNKPTNEDGSPRWAVAPGSASFQILKQALADDAFEGGEIACFGDYAVSWNTRENIVAIAATGGWWTMPAADLKAIAAATPNAEFCGSGEQSCDQRPHKLTKK